MGTFDKTFREATRKIPEIVLTKLIREKLIEAGMAKPGRLPRKIATLILEGKTDEISVGDDDINLTFDEKDFQEFERRTSKILDKMPDVVFRAAKSAAKTMADGLFSQYDAYLRGEARTFANFRNNLEDRWGLALDGLRLLLQMNLEFGQEQHARTLRSKAKRGIHKSRTIGALHTRGCQVIREIITLLENGLADGAMARWRTLHELVVVAYFLDTGGDELSERYTSYEAIEAKKSLDVYLSVYESLGFKKPSVRDVRATNEEYQRAISTFGSDFKNDLGWVGSHIGNKSPRFADLEKHAGRSMMRSHYKMASFKVHASPRGLTCACWMRRPGQLRVRQMPASKSPAGIAPFTPPFGCP